MHLNDIKYLSEEEMIRIIVDTAVEHIVDPCKFITKLWYKSKNPSAKHIGVGDRLILRRMAKQYLKQIANKHWIADFAKIAGIEIAYLDWPEFDPS